MALGRQWERQSEMSVTWAELPRAPRHAFFDQLQSVLLAAGFDTLVEVQCAPLPGSIPRVDTVRSGYALAGTGILTFHFGKICRLDVGAFYGNIQQHQTLARA